MNNNTEILCKYLGGSNLYHLNTPESDLDVRGVFLNTQASYVLGLNKHDEERKIDKNEDFVLKEFRHYMALLRQANTEALEVLWCDKTIFNSLSVVFEGVRSHKHNLIDSKRLFNALRGYASGEVKLATGVRSGQLGSKRKQALEKYGFSPKNFTNLFRLMFTGINFYETGDYVVDCKLFGTKRFDFLMEVKTNPQKHTKEGLEKLYVELDKELEEKYEKCSFITHFDEPLANHLLLDAYLPYLIENQKESCKAYKNPRKNER